MDSKLAVGMARDLLRSVHRINSTDLSRSPFTACYNRITTDYCQRSGIPKAHIVSRALELRDQLNASGPILASCQIIRHPTKKRALIESTRPAVTFGEEQWWLVVASILLELRTDEMLMVETSTHVALSLHAFARLFERGGFHEAQLPDLMETISLWAVPLLQTLRAQGWKLGTETVMPFKGGLLLGTLEANNISPDQGPTATTFRRNSIEPAYLDPAFGVLARGVMTIGLNTFVGPRDLFDDQKEILRFMESFETTHREVMINLRNGARKGLPDPRMLDRFGAAMEFVGTDDLERIHSLLAAFQNSDQWRTNSEAHRRPTRFLN